MTDTIWQGASYTWKLGHGNYPYGGSTSTIYSGPYYGPVILEVWAMP